MVGINWTVFLETNYNYLLWRFLESQRQSSVQNNIYANVYNWKFPKSSSDGYNWFLQPVRNEYYKYDPISNDTTKPLLNWDNTRTQVLKF